MASEDAKQRLERMQKGRSMIRGSTLLATLTKSLRFAGRSTVSEFWLFLPVGVSLCMIAGVIARQLDFTFMGIVLSVFCASLHLLAVWWRRLQDVCVWGANIAFAAISLLVCLFSGAAAYALYSDKPPLSMDGGVALFLFITFPDLLFRFFLGKWVAMLVAFVSLIIFLIRFTFALSQTLLPSQQGTNRYGPNPNEVTT